MFPVSLTVLGIQRFFLLVTCSFFAYSDPYWLQGIGFNFLCFFNWNHLLLAEVTAHSPGPYWEHPFVHNSPVERSEIP